MGTRIELCGQLAVEIEGTRIEGSRSGVAAARGALAQADAAAAFAATERPLEIAGRGLLPGLEAAWIDVRRAELGDPRLEALEVRAAAGAAMDGPEQNEAERPRARRSRRRRSESPRGRR